jgi:hypothetical protein
MQNDEHLENRVKNDEGRKEKGWDKKSIGERSALNIVFACKEKV